MTELGSLCDLEKKVQNAVSEALPTIKLPRCLMLRGINIDIIEVTDCLEEERIYIVGRVDVDVDLYRTII